MFMAKLIDEKGKRWVYEGKIDNHPIWVAEKKGTPLMMSESEAMSIAKEYLLPKEKICIERA